MPIELHYDESTSVVTMTAKGIVTIEEVIEYENIFISQYPTPREFIEIIKTEELDDVVFSYTSFKALAISIEQWKKHGQKATLFCAFSQKHKEIAELLLPIFQHLDITIQVCYSPEELQEMTQALGV